MFRRNFRVGPGILWCWRRRRRGLGTTLASGRRSGLRFRRQKGRLRRRRSCGRRRRRRVLETRRQDIEGRVVADRTRDLAHYGVAGQAQLTHYLTDGAHHLRQIVGWNDNQRYNQEQDYFENAQRTSVRRPPLP